MTTISGRQFAEHTLALVIGISNYDDKTLTLASAAKSATQIYDCLIDAQSMGLPSQHVTLLIDSTKVEIEAAIKTLASSGSTDCTLFLFYVGHGDVVADEHYILPRDACLDELHTTAISSSSLASILVPAPAVGLLAMFDCCHGGALVRSIGSQISNARESSFRRVLCAASSKQKSWEFPNLGTLFSRNLIRILQGQLIVSETPGQIYVDDLKRELDRAIRQDLEELGEIESLQQVVEASFGAADPLVFVHRGLSADRLTVKTLRYDSEYVRKRILIAAARTIGSLAIVFGFLLIIADNSQVATFENGNVVIDRGFVRWNPPGYPAFLTATDIPATATGDDPAFRLNGAARLGGPLLGKALPMVEGHLRPEWQVVLFSLEGRTEEAHRTAKAVAVGIHKNGMRVWPDAEAIRDLGLIAPHDYLNLFIATVDDGGAAPETVANAAFAALARVSPSTAIEEIANDDLSRVRPDSSIVQNLDAACTPKIQRYLNDVIAKTKADVASGAESLHWIGAVLRTGCDLPVGAHDALVAQGWQDVASMFDAFRPSTERNALLAEKIDREIKNYNNGTSASARIDLENDLRYAWMVDPSLVPGTAEKLLHASDVSLRLAAADALARTVTYASAVRVAAKLHPELLWSLVNADLIHMDDPDNPCAVLPSGTNVFRCLDHPSTLGAAALRQLAMSKSAYVRIRALQIMADRSVTFDAEPFSQQAVVDKLHLNQIRDDVRWWYLRYGKNDRMLLADLNEMSADDVAGALGAHPLSSQLDAAVHELIKKPETMDRAAIVLAMTGTAIDLAHILTSPQVSTRAIGAQYGAFNPRAKEAIKIAMSEKSKTVATFELYEQVRRLDTIRSLMERCPRRLLQELTKNVTQDSYLGTGARLRILAISSEIAGHAVAN